MKRHLIIGTGVAGTTAAEYIRRQDRDGSITILTDEDLPFYNRMKLNELISGELTEKDLVLKKETWYREQNIQIKVKARVRDGDPEKKIVMTEKGESFAYDWLLVATGSHSFIPPMKGAEKKGVFALRTIQDARDIASYVQDVEDVVLIGGGLLGLETGRGLRNLGKKVMVVEFFPRLLPRQLDVNGAKRLQSIMEGMGFSFRLGAKTQEIQGEEKVAGVLLEGGEILPAGMVIISAGVRPNMELAGPLGLQKDKGIIVDERLRTNRPEIYAAGDVAEFKGVPYGIWPAALEQGKIAGTNMAGGDMVYKGTTMANTLKVVGVDLASAGDIDAENRFESRVVTEGTVYKKIVVDNDHIIGCIMLGDTKNFNQITKLIADKRDISGVRDKILSEGFDFRTLS